MENKIIEIEVERLHPHPNNPRKNVGDVSELSESIKKSGIMQNLTVVPWVSEMTGKGEEGEYTVIIGHRRMAAAKQAGLKSVPCIVKEMTPAEQLATMLAENVQRSDLTPFEQAEGIQMMFDIGESVADVVQKTGLSETTVRRRAKMLEMDRETLRKTEGRGATLADYEKLNQIEDIKKRNEILADIGTNNFNMKLKDALDEQRKNKNKKEMFEKLDTFAEKVTSYPTGCLYFKSWSYDEGAGKISIPNDAWPGEYVYYPNSYNVVLYKKQVKKESPETAEREKERREKQEREEARREKVKELAKKAYELRLDFVKNFKPTSKHADAIMRMLWCGACFAGDTICEGDIDKICGTALDAAEDDAAKLREANDYFDKNPIKTELCVAYSLFGDGFSSYVRPWNGEWYAEPDIDKLYYHLEELGYQISDDELKLMDGSHELFVKE
ncbi:MAG: ParB/RepB/Spo0J family partition protein [Ruminococcus bromii]|nr:ParB/RepB/Spo0J family partition protein [Ruminococcus bromii]